MAEVTASPITLGFGSEPLLATLGFGAGSPTAPATLAGTGALTATGTASYSAPATLAGTGALTATGTASYTGAATLSGTGALSATGTGSATYFTGAVTLAGTGNLTATGTATYYGSAVLAGEGGLRVTISTLSILMLVDPDAAELLTGDVTGDPAVVSGGSILLQGFGGGSILLQGFGMGTVHVAPRIDPDAAELLTTEVIGDPVTTDPPNSPWVKATGDVPDTLAVGDWAVVRTTADPDTDLLVRIVDTLDGLDWSAVAWWTEVASPYVLNLADADGAELILV